MTDLLRHKEASRSRTHSAASVPAIAVRTNSLFYVKIKVWKSFRIGPYVMFHFFIVISIEYLDRLSFRYAFRHDSRSVRKCTNCSHQNVTILPIVRYFHSHWRHEFERTNIRDQAFVKRDIGTAHQYTAIMCLYLYSLRHLFGRIIGLEIRLHFCSTG
ncbi:unnamed protein product [Albugo candida]|uniref:Uncharacterized protein n=1 Tax=Albugo candida TaxID=65357 RepID=A0A024GLD7_9STRA|nr:unnamed protein product [Albugo candida]|eukprot:CCI47698.1 unnamed protein product [Albugo candida]